MKQSESSTPNLLYGFERLEEVISQDVLEKSEVILNLSSRVKNHKYLKGIEESLSGSQFMLIVFGFFSLMMTIALVTLVPSSIASSIERGDFFTSIVLIVSIFITILFLYPFTKYYFSMYSKLKKLYSDPLKTNLAYLEKYGTIQDGKVLQINQLDGRFEIQYESLYTSSNVVVKFSQVYITSDPLSIKLNSSIKVLVLNKYVNIIL